MTQLLHATRRDTAETRAVLERIEKLLSGGDAALLVADRVPAANFVATGKGTLYHRDDCPSVVGRSGLVFRIGAAAVAQHVGRVRDSPHPM